jgi:hypothetical protein
MPTPFDRLTADLNDQRVRTFHVQCGGHPSRFAPDDISAVFLDVPKNYRWGGALFYSLCSIHKIRATNADVAKAFIIRVEGGRSVSVAGAAKLKDGKITSNGRYLVDDERR